MFTTLMQQTLEALPETVSAAVLQLPVPDGPDMPEEVDEKIILGLTILWGGLLAVCMAIAMYGIGSMAMYKKKERYDEANSGMTLAIYAVGGAVGIGLLAPIFNFMGVV